MASAIKSSKESIFGTGAQAGPTKTSQTTLRPEDLAAIQRQQQTLGAATTQFARQSQRFGEQAAANIPTLGAISAPSFQTTLDPLSQQLVSQGTQALQRQAASQRGAISRQFRGQPGVARALQAQTGIQSRLQQNPLLFQAAQQQVGRELSQGQARLASEQASNQALLQQSAAQRAALGQAQQFGGGALQAQAGLLGVLGQLGELLGTKTESSQLPGTKGIFGTEGLK